jgi:hypothetical protein
MSNNNSLMAVYSAHSDAAAGVRELQKSGFELRKLSIAGKLNDAEKDDSACAIATDHTERDRKTGPISVYPLVVLGVSSSVCVTGIGPILLVGPLASVILANIKRADTVELNDLNAGLYSLGIPVGAILRHESCLREDKVLLLAEGTAAELMWIKDVLRTTHPEEVHIHFVEEPVVSHA